MLKRWNLALTAIGVSVVTGVMGCTPKDSGVKGAALVAMNALQINDITRVTVDVQATVIPDPLTIPLVRDGYRFAAVVSDLPVGTDYSFTVSAKDASDSELYRGTVTNQTIAKGQTASIVINMNQVAPGVAIDNQAPVIDSLTATSLSVSQNDVVTIAASAHDPDAGQTALMTWSWATTCGTLGAPSTIVGTDEVAATSTVIFTSPSADGPCTVTVSVTDANGVLQNVVSFAIQVNASTGTGHAKVVANVNTYPVISGLNATPVPLSVGVATNLTVTAADPDGDVLNYLWSSPDCTGDFGSTAASSTTFTLTTAPTNLKCTFVMRVDDGSFPDGTAKGGVITNRLVLPVFGAGSTVVSAPVFGYDYQSRDTISGGDVVNFAIVANQGCTGGSISLAWVASDNTALGSTTPSAIALDPTLFHASAATYTAPVGAEDGGVVTITVTATCSSSHLSTSHTFKLSPLNGLCYGSPGTISAGYDKTCAVKTDRSLWCWGNNLTDLCDSVPVQVVALGSPVLKVSAGTNYTCAIKSDRSLWCWGVNGYGQLGDGTTTFHLTPVQVTTLGASVLDVAAGWSSTCASKTDGTLWCWGRNNVGQLGEGTTTNHPAPAQVTALGTSVLGVAIPVIGEHACAYKSEGTVWCWGANEQGQLGDGTTTQRLAPVQVTALGSVVHVVAGSSHYCARKSDGTLWCWGSNSQGQLGDGTRTQRNSAVQVTALGSSVVQVAAGMAHTCAVKSDGTLWCWGYNSRGQLGVSAPSLTPVQVTDLGTSVVDVAAGPEETCARKRDGTLWCWGLNDWCQLGDGTSTNRPAPVQVTGFTAQQAPLCQ